MNKKFARFMLTMLFIAVLLVPTSVSASADSFTVNEKYEVYFFEFVSCAAGGEGEWVELTGTVHDSFHVTYDARGGFHLTDHWNYQGIKGIGWTTGDKYRATGAGQYNVTSKVGYEETSVWHFKVNGQGPGNKFTVRANFHITVNANGTVTAYHDNWTVECK